MFFPEEAVEGIARTLNRFFDTKFSWSVHLWLESPLRPRRTDGYFYLLDRNGIVRLSIDVVSPTAELRLYGHWCTRTKWYE